MAEGLQAKEVANIAVDNRRNRDLISLSSEVDDFTANDLVSDAEKNKRLYLEIRYARDTALSVPKTSNIFRLKKRNYKILPTEVCHYHQGLPKYS